MAGQDNSEYHIDVESIKFKKGMSEEEIHRILFEWNNTIVDYPVNLSVQNYSNSKQIFCKRLFIIQITD